MYTSLTITSKYMDAKWTELEKDTNALTQLDPLMLLSNGGMNRRKSMRKTSRI